MLYYITFVTLLYLCCPKPRGVNSFFYTIQSWGSQHSCLFAYVSFLSQYKVEKHVFTSVSAKHSNNKSILF